MDMLTHESWWLLFAYVANYWNQESISIKQRLPKIYANCIDMVSSQPGNSRMRLSLVQIVNEGWLQSKHVKPQCQLNITRNTRERHHWIVGWVNGRACLVECGNVWTTLLKTEVNKCVKPKWSTLLLSHFHCECFIFHNRTLKPSSHHAYAMFATDIFFTCLLF